MKKLLVNAPSGAQQVVEVGEGGWYFDPSRVLWDERVDGPLPSHVQVGGMYRAGNELRLDESLLAIEMTMREEEAKKPVTLEQRVEALEKALAGLKAGK